MKDNFDHIYRQISRPLSLFIAKRTGASSEVVEDLFSQTMVAAWKGWHKFHHKSSYFTWICRIALNKIADYYRSQIHRESRLVAPLLESLIDPEAMNPEEKLALEDLRRSVVKCLNLLPDETRQLLVLKYWKEKTLNEMASLLQISPKAVESKLYRARRAFAKLANRL